MRLLCYLLSISFLAAACSSGASDRDATREVPVEIPGHLQEVENMTVLPRNPQPRYKIDLVREHNYGDKYDDVVYLGYIHDFDVDDRGRVYLADAINDQIHVYNPDGSFLRSIGRSGRGPGEFLTAPTHFRIGVNDEYLFVYDISNFRITRFSLDNHELADIVNLDYDKWDQVEDLTGRRPFQMYSREDHTYLAHFRVSDRNFDRENMPQGLISAGRSQFYRFSPQMEPVSDVLMEYDHPESLFLQRGGQNWLFSPPFLNVVLTGVSPSGQLYRASSDEFFIEIFEPEGTYARSLYHPMEAAPFTTEDRERLVEINDSYSHVFGAIESPDRWPLLNQITVDSQNRLWVSVITESREQTEWWVISEEGVLLGTAPWPRKLDDRPGDEARNFIIKNDAIYYLSSDAMNLDEQTVIKYRIEMTEVQGEG